MRLANKLRSSWTCNAPPSVRLGSGVDLDPAGVKCFETSPFSKTPAISPIFRSTLRVSRQCGSFRPDGTTRRPCSRMRCELLRQAREGDGGWILLRRRGSGDPPGQNRDPQGPTPLHLQPQAPFTFIDPCVFAVVFDHSLRVAAHSVMRNGPAVTSIYSSCGPAMTRSARVELRAGVDSTRAVFRRRF
jgi:hypothetical protein